MSFDFDEELAEDLIGSTLLVGITYLSASGQFQSCKQYFGTVVAANTEEGIELQLAGKNKGESYSMPPDTSCISAADPGVYTLSESKETIENPDYLCSWEVYKKRQLGTVPS